MKSFVAAALSSAAILSAGAAWSGDVVVLTDTAWVEAPSVAAVAAAYPVRAREAAKSGAVLLNCVFSATGRLSRCETVAESPGSYGFALAARSLTGYFLGPLELPDGRTVAGSHAQIAFKFVPEALQAQTVTRPEWTMLPTPAQFQAAFPEAASKAGVLKAKAVMNCTAAPGGVLADCQAGSEEPGGYGFAAATLPLASAFRLKTWTTDGQPVVGGKVRVPIRYELQQAALPAAAKP